MNKENKVICEKLSKLYDSNLEFYKLIKDTADKVKSYSFTSKVLYSSLVLTIIAVWEEKRDKFWNQKVGNKK